jgi:hypothetical protein
VTGPSDIFRPSWAVMAPARGGGAFPAGAHEVHWTQEGDAFRPGGPQQRGGQVVIPLTREELEAMSRCLRETVERRRAMTQGERDAELLAIAELDRRRP